MLGVAPRVLFEHLFISTTGSRVEVSTVVGTTTSSFAHVMNASDGDNFYGKAFNIKSTAGFKFKLRISQHHRVILNGVDFRSQDRNLEETHWSINEVENSGICGQTPNKVVSLQHQLITGRTKVFGNRTDSTKVSMPCDITFRVTVPNIKQVRDKENYGPTYEAYQTSNVDHLVTTACNSIAIWRFIKGRIIEPEDLTKIPIHSVSHLKWQMPIVSEDKMPSLAERCLAE
jgi:hypothetical protein